MRKFALIWIIALVAVVNFSGYAAAQQQNCTGKSDSGWDTQIAACTAVIKASKGQGKDLASAFGNRGNAYFAEAQYDRAIQDLDQAIKLDPTYAEAFNDRCWSRTIVGRELDQALKDCNESLRLRPNNGDTLDTRGFTYFKLDQYDNAIADYDVVLKLNPKVATSLYGRGLAKQRKGDATGGDEDIVAAKAIDPKIADKLAGYGVK